MRQHLQVREFFGEAQPTASEVLDLCRSLMDDAEKEGFTPEKTVVLDRPPGVMELTVGGFPYCRVLQDYLVMASQGPGNYLQVDIAWEDDNGTR